MLDCDGDGVLDLYCEVDAPVVTITGLGEWTVTSTVPEFGYSTPHPLAFATPASGVAFASPLPLHRMMTD